MTTYNTLCNDVSSNSLLSSLSPSFPPALLRPECQLIALLYHTCKLNTSTVSYNYVLTCIHHLYTHTHTHTYTHTHTHTHTQPSLLHEVATTLYSAALSPLVNFHRMAAITRIFTAICRLLGDSERVLFLSCDLLRRKSTILYYRES